MCLGLLTRHVIPNSGYKPMKILLTQRTLLFRLLKMTPPQALTLNYVLSFDKQFLYSWLASVI